MRDFDLTDVVFTDSDYISHTIKDMKDLTAVTYQTWFNYEVQPGDDIDEIASRRSTYGEDFESEFYKIMEHNRVSLFDHQFDLSRIKTLKIPMP